MTLAAQPRVLDAKVLEVRDECRGVKTFRLGVPNDYAFAPGMWVMVSFPDDPKTWRAYSISTSPLDKGHIELTLARVGDFTKRLFSLQGGETLKVKGPYGKWLYREDPLAVLVAGGTGITPARSFARYALAKGLEKRLVVFYSCRTLADMLYRGELETFAARGLKVYASVTRPDGAPWNGPTGHIDLATVRAQVPGWETAAFYLCGPASLVASMKKQLLGAGVPSERVRHEIWGDYKDLWS